jgi:hypothetical protein
METTEHHVVFTLASSMTTFLIHFFLPPPPLPPPPPPLLPLTVLLLLTVIVTSSLDEIWLSLAVRRKTYVPATENEAVVLGAEALPKVTVPGPLTIVQVVVTAPGGFGKPSSVTVPLRLADAGNVII